jgi:hypothetical protein
MLRSLIISISVAVLVWKSIDFVYISNTGGYVATNNSAVSKWVKTCEFQHEVVGGLVTKISHNKSFNFKFNRWGPYFWVNSEKGKLLVCPSDSVMSLVTGFFGESKTNTFEFREASG